MDLGILLLRMTVGLALAAHGSQKVFGWFGGYGPDGTGQFMEALGFRPVVATRWRRVTWSSWEACYWPSAS
jgi:putative oxidoreductase